MSNPTIAPTTDTMTNSSFAITSNVTIQPPSLELEPSYLAIYFTFRWIWSVLSVGGNSLTIICVTKFQNLQTNTNYFICSLAMADILGGLLTPFLMWHQLMANSSFFVPVCLFEKILSISSTGANLVSTLWIAVDRYIYIAFPLKYPMIMTQNLTFVLIGVTWAFWLLQSAISVILMNNLTIGMTCKFAVFLPGWFFYNWLTAALIVLLILPVILHLGITLIAWGQYRKIQAMNHTYDTMEASSVRKLLRIGKMMFIVAAVFLFTYIPQVIGSVFIRENPSRVTLVIEKFTVIIFWSNTWLNPFIYAWRSNDFRFAFRKQLRLRVNTVEPESIEAS